MQTTAFTNNHIDPKALPSVSELTFTPLERQYKINNLLLSAGITLGIIFIVSILKYLPFLSLPSELPYNSLYTILVIGFLGLCYFLYHLLADPIKCYALREKDISYRSGLIFRKTVTQPLQRVQHVEVERGPIERSTGLATLQVFSAGGAGHTFAVPGLAHSQAMHIRHYILTHKEGVDLQTQNTSPDHVASPHAE